MRRNDRRVSAVCVSIDEKPVRRCARQLIARQSVDASVSIDEKPVRRCAARVSSMTGIAIECPSMRNPSGGAPAKPESLHR